MSPLKLPTLAAAGPANRYPAYFWPLLGGISVIGHLLLWGYCQRLVLTVQSPLPNAGQPVPVTLLAPDSAVSPSSPTAVSPTPAPETSDQTAASAPAMPPATAVPPATVSQSLLSGSDSPAAIADPPAPTTAPTVPSSDAPPPVPGDRTGNVAPISPGEAETAPPPETSAPGPASSPPTTEAAVTGSGQMIPVDIRSDPQGHDLPDVPPQIPRQTVVAIQPWLQGCGWSPATAAASPGASATLQLRITVEVDGRISAASVLPGAGSGNPALDRLATCLVQATLQVQPGMTGGSPHPTSGSILTVQLSLP